MVKKKLITNEGSGFITNKGASFITNKTCAGVYSCAMGDV
jgi:hypothetical protein